MKKEPPLQGAKLVANSNAAELSEMNRFHRIKPIINLKIKQSYPKSYLQSGCWGLAVSLDSSGSLSPSAFTATTLNTYSLSSRSLEAVNDVVSLSTEPAFTHCVLRASRFSIT